MKNIKDLDSLVKHVRKNLRSGPVCDAIFKCPGWEENDHSLTDSREYGWKFCPWCGKEIR